MLTRRIFVATVIAGLMLPAVMGCLMPAAAQAQAMECCEKLICARGHQKQACFSDTAPTGSSQATPELRTSLAVSASASDLSLHAQTEVAAAASWAAFAAAPQHSPPELYALHSALLL